MLINVFLLMNEVFKEFYSKSKNISFLDISVLRAGRTSRAGAVDLDGHDLQSHRHVPADPAAHAAV